MAAVDRHEAELVKRWPSQPVLDATLDLVRGDDFQALQLHAEATEPVAQGQRPIYGANVILVAHRQTGDYLTRWGGVRVDITAPAILEGLPLPWAIELADLVQDVAPMLGARLGSIRWGPGILPRTTTSYELANYGPVGSPRRFPAPPGYACGHPRWSTASEECNERAQPRRQRS